MRRKLLCFVILILTSFGGRLLFAELRDPTMPPMKIDQIPRLNAGLFQVNAILLSYDRRIAVINGEYKKVGDAILGSRITAINKNTVQLEGPSGKITLFLLGKPVKRLSGKESI